MRSKNFIIAVVLALVVLIGAVFLYRQFMPQPSTQPAELRSNPELEKAYERDVSAMLQPFWSTSNPAGLREKILTVSTPAKYLDVHLDIVLAFDLIEQGQLEADQAKIEAGIDALNRIRQENSWLD